MKKVKVQYVAGSEIREVELENVNHWETIDRDSESASLRFLSGEHDIIAEIENVVAVIRV